MYLDKEKKKDIYIKYGKSIHDTGNTSVQIALLTFQISHLSKHLKIHKKDLNTERALINLVGKRKKMLKYFEKINISEYKKIILDLGIRK